MKISDELRANASTAWLNHMADRIDLEMIELPKDADGKPIHVDDLVWLDDGRRACVTEIDINDNHVVVDCWDGSKHMACHPSDITRKQPDSWERIADELVEAKGWRDQNGEYNCNISSVSTKTLGDWADRIRRLAAKEG